MGTTGPDMVLALRQAATFWYLWTSAAFLKEYLEVAAGSVFLPTSQHETETLLNVFLLDKSVYELAYELNNRPNWVEVPLRGILDLLETSRSATELPLAT
jgi:maltose alpha-D-glucosyltransferase/alpha-amylase